jgi:hypothetical protein
VADPSLPQDFEEALGDQAVDREPACRGLETVPGVAEAEAAVLLGEERKKRSIGNRPWTALLRMRISEEVRSSGMLASECLFVLLINGQPRATARKSPTPPKCKAGTQTMLESISSTAAI